MFLRLPSPTRSPLLAALMFALLLPPACDRPPKSDESDKSDKSDKSDQSDQSDKSDKSDQSDQSDKSDKSDQSDKSDKSDKSDPPPSSSALPRCLHLVWNGHLLDVKNESPFVPRQIQLPALLKQLRDLATDSTVKAILIEHQAFEGPITSFWELRRALDEVRANKKKIYFHAHGYDLRAYFLATAADEIVLHPAGAWEVAGLAMEFTFLKDALALVGVSADFLQVGKFKGAAENLTRNAMSPELRLSLDAMLDSVYESLLAPMAASRALTVDALRALVDRGFLDPEAARTAKLIDRVEGFDPLLQRLRQTYRVEKAPRPAKPRPNLFELFSAQAAEREPDYPHIALLQAQGPIYYAGEDPSSLLGEESQIAALDFLKTLEKIKKNQHVRGIILRINSPGGSALASDILWLSLREAAGDRPMVASMGATAASGGYYLASAAPTIFASPFTLTGSIGVVGGKLVFQDTLSKLKVGTELLTRGRNAGYLSSSRPFTPQEREMIASSMDRTYKLFLERVRTTRPRVKNLEELAQGRIWSGDQAVKNGLVDRLGGLQDAAAEVRRLAGLTPDTPVLIYPRPKPWLQQLSEMFDPDSAIDAKVSRLIRARWPLGRAVLRTLAAAGVLARERTAVLLPLAVEGP